MVPRSDGGRDDETRFEAFRSSDAVAAAVVGIGSALGYVATGNSPVGGAVAAFVLGLLVGYRRPHTADE